MAEPSSFLQDPSIMDSSCNPKHLGRFSIPSYLWNCDDESISAIVFVVLGFFIVAISLLAGLIVVRVQDAQARRGMGSGDAEGTSAEDEEVFPPYYDEEPLEGQDEEDLLDDKDGL